MVELNIPLWLTLPKNWSTNFQEPISPNSKFKSFNCQSDAHKMKSLSITPVKPLIYFHN